VSRVGGPGGGGRLIKAWGGPLACGPRTGRRASLGLGGGGGVRGGDGRSWGMTGGPPLSASAGGGERSCGGLPGRKAKWAAALLAYAAGAAAGPEARLRAAKLGRGDRCCRLLRAGLGW
jgi:hypothetical protein